MLNVLHGYRISPEKHPYIALLCLGQIHVLTLSPWLPSTWLSKMALLSFALTPWALLPLVLVGLYYYLYPYRFTYRHLRRIPAPFPAQYSNLWLLSVCRRGERYKIVDDVHQKLGPVVRIQPNHVSIADDEAIQVIYGHGNGFLKS